MSLAHDAPHVPPTGFDFLLGSWAVQNRRLDDPSPARASETWSEFPSWVTAWSILDGRGVADTYTFTSFPRRGEFHGFALRLFDPESDLWRIWWAASRPAGLLDPPVVGSFVDGVGLFAGEDRLGDLPILVKTRYGDVTPTSLRWEQAFSFDGGQTYETNWIMIFERLGRPPKRHLIATDEGQSG